MCVYSISKSSRTGDGEYGWRDNLLFEWKAYRHDGWIFALATDLAMKKSREKILVWLGNYYKNRYIQYLEELPANCANSYYYYCNYSLIN